MEPDDHVCLCFHVSQRKLAAFLRRERPTVASQLSECLGAGTGCGWCIPSLKEMHRRWEAGEEPTLPFAPAAYAEARTRYRREGRRDPPAERSEE